jgi:hypothetical protein
MFSAHISQHTSLSAMLVTAIILIDLRAVINAAATTIGDPHNPNLGWGLGLGSLFGGSGQMGTADLVNNITSTILQMKFQVDKNKALISLVLSPQHVY